MSGPHDATAGSVETYRRALAERGEPAIMPRLLRGAVAVCIDCDEPIPAGAARVTVANPSRPKAPWYRCGDCEYRAVYG